MDDRKKTAVAALSVFLNTCAPALQYREPAISDVPEFYPEENAPPAPPALEDPCTPGVAEAAKTMADFARPVTRGQGETHVLYTIVTDDAFEERYGNGDRLVDRYVGIVEATAARISEFANIRFTHAYRAMPEPPPMDEVWFNIVFSGERAADAGQAYTEWRDGIFYQATLTFYIPVIESMVHEGMPAPYAAEQAVQHEFIHAFGVHGHLEDIFPDRVDSQGNYRFTAAISPLTTSMTRNTYIDYDNHPELDLCMLTEIYEKRNPSSEISPAEKRESGKGDFIWRGK